MRTKQLLAIGAAAIGILSGPAAASAKPDDLSVARAATAQYHDISAAVASGYGPFTDAQGIACIDNPGVGGMGIHYVNGDLVAGGVIDAARPQALVYEPQPNGRLRLVAVEYIAFQAPWELAHATPPSLFGRQFELVTAPNRYGLPPFYELHAWLWSHNPLGMFDDWNPRVSCPAA